MVALLNGPTLAEIKNSIDLRTWFENQFHPQVARKGKDSTNYDSPFGGGHDNLTIYSHGWFIDWSGGSKVEGDIFNLVFHAGLAPLGDFKAALEVVVGDKSIDFKPMTKTAERPKREKSDKLTLETVASAHEWADVAEQYWSQRGINRATIDAFKMGHMMEPWGYDMGSGKTLWTQVGVFTIPYLRLVNGETTVTAIQRRVDPGFASAFLVDPKNESSIAKVRGHLAEIDHTAPELVPDKLVLEKMLGPRYRLIGNWSLFNSHILLDIKGNSWSYRRLPYVIVVEDEASALSLWERGYYAIAGKPIIQNKLSLALKVIPRILFAYDSDAPGQKNAWDAFTDLGRGQIIPMLAGYKDPNEIVAAGKTENWLDQYRVQPIGNIEVPKWQLHNKTFSPKQSPTTTREETQRAPKKPCGTAVAGASMPPILGGLFGMCSPTLSS